jgi:hypothetical protein
MIWPSAPVVAQYLLYAAVALVGVHLLFLFLLLGVAMLRARALRARRAVSAEVRPALHAALVEFLAGGKDDSIIRNYSQAHRGDIAESILLFQGTVGGSARDRLCELSLDLGLVQEWCEEGRSRDVIRRRTALANLAFACSYEPCRRFAAELMLDALQDDDEEVRLSACRGVLLSERPEQIKRLFEVALQPNLLMRIVLTEDLRRHALSLASGPVKAALSSGEAKRARATLDILVAWERAIPVDDLRELLEHRDREIRVLAFRLASFVTLDFESRLALLRSLNDEDAAIRGLAIVAVGRQKMTQAIPELARCLRLEGLQQARQAAAALGDMPPDGWRALEELSTNSNLVTALAAGEALARAKREV